MNSTQSNNSWTERKAEELVNNFLEQDLVPENALKSVNQHLRKGDPNKALEKILNARKSSKAKQISRLEERY